VSGVPLITSHQFDLLVLAPLFGPITGLALWAWFKSWRDARTDRLIRRGMRAAWRRGYLRDGDQ